MHSEPGSGHGDSWYTPTIHGEQRGSLLVAAAMFLLIFLFIAALGVDRTRYYMKSSKLQAIADGAVKAGGQAFNTYSDSPPLDRVRNAMLNYVRQHQGEEHRDLYEVESDTYGQGFAIKSLNPPSTSNTCTKGFSIHNGQLITTQPGTFKTTILGSALASDEELAPVTTKLDIQRRTEPDTTIQAWGSYEDPEEGNVNVGGNPDEEGGADWGAASSPMDSMKLDSGETITSHGQSWWDFDGDGDPESYVKDSTHDHPTNRDYTITLSNGDKLPDYVLEAGFNQPGTAEFFEPYIDSDGTIDLEQNQALVLFDLDNSDHHYDGEFNVEETMVDGEPQDLGDYQDLIQLVTFVPQSTTSVSNYYSAPSKGTKSNPCPPHPPGSFRIGITVYGKSHHLFLPNFVRDEQAKGIKRTSVARVVPQPMFEKASGAMYCSVYSYGPIQGPADAFGDGENDLCATAAVDLENPIGGGPGTIYAPENVDVDQAVHFTIQRLSEDPPEPAFRKTNPSDYEVKFTEAEFLGWDPNSCDSSDTYVRAAPGLEWAGPGPPGSNTVCVRRDNSGDYIVSHDPPGTLRANDGTSVSIYVDGSIVLVGDNNTVDGGIFAEGNIAVGDANFVARGDPGLLGGLALWSQQGVILTGDNPEVQGILGGKGSVNATGDNLNLDGVLYSGGNLDLDDDADLDHVPGNYDTHFVENIPWVDHSQNDSGQPLYSNISVMLVD